MVRTSAIQLAIMRWVSQMFHPHTEIPQEEIFARSRYEDQVFGGRTANRYLYCSYSILSSVAAGIASLPCAARFGGRRFRQSACSTRQYHLLACQAVRRMTKPICCNRSRQSCRFRPDGRNAHRPCGRRTHRESARYSRRRLFLLPSWINSPEASIKSVALSFAGDDDAGRAI